MERTILQRMAMKKKEELKEKWELKKVGLEKMKGDVVLKKTEPPFERTLRMKKKKKEELSWRWRRCPQNSV